MALSIHSAVRVRSPAGARGHTQNSAHAKEYRLAAQVSFVESSGKMLRDRETLYCTFCRKNQHVVWKLIRAHDNIAICDECVEICVAILAEEASKGPGKPPKPRVEPDEPSFKQILQVI